jgi:hypothetical protein
VLPGDLPRFDLDDGQREFLISAKRKEIRDERVPESESHEMGLQISCRFHAEATQETGVWGAASASGRIVSRFASSTIWSSFAFDFLGTVENSMPIAT